MAAEPELESAIPDCLVLERTVAPVKGADFKPPFPLWASRFPRDTKDLVMAVFGAQYAPGIPNDGNAIGSISAFISKGNAQSRPGFWEVATVTDNKGYYNVALTMYWKSSELYQEWTSSSGFQSWWDNLEPGEHNHGWFSEVFLPTIQRIETIVTSQWPQGVSNLRETMSGPIREHVYWGSMRDRLPVTQVDRLDGEPTAIKSKEELMDLGPIRGRFQVRGRKNLVVIRSGQDWSEASPEERELYFNDMRPALVDGMDFIRDNGPEVGCISNRFMTIVEPDNNFRETEATFCLGYFESLEALEKWSKEHPTHLRIFGEFAKYAKKLGDKMSLRLFHEVMSLEPEQQTYEYIDCHPGTGLLAAS